MRFARNLAVLLNYRTQPRQIPASNHAPVARRCNRRRAGEARPRGKAGNERRKACFHPGGSGFHLPRGRGGSAAFQFYQLDFYVTTQPSLVLSWAPRKYRPPSSLLSSPFIPPRPPSPRKFRLPFAANCGNIKAITHWRCLRCRIRFCNRFRAPCRRISRT